MPLLSGPWDLFSTAILLWEMRMSSFLKRSSIFKKQKLFLSTSPVNPARLLGLGEIANIVEGENWKPRNCFLPLLLLKCVTGEGRGVFEKCPVTFWKATKHMSALLRLIRVVSGHFLVKQKTSTLLLSWEAIPTPWIKQLPYCTKSSPADQAFQHLISRRRFCLVK